MKAKPLDQLETLKDFYFFYNEIPEDKWCVWFFESLDEKGKCCAIGHLGQHKMIGKESAPAVKRISALLFGRVCYPAELAGINNSPHSLSAKIYDQDTPKKRVLAYLKDKIVEKEDANFELAV